jgi:hypothetical protein
MKTKYGQHISERKAPGVVRDALKERALRGETIVQALLGVAREVEGCPVGGRTSFTFEGMKVDSDSAYALKRGDQGSAGHVPEYVQRGRRPASDAGPGDRVLFEAMTRKYLSDVCRDEHEHETFEAELACHLRRNDVDNNGYAVTPDSKPFGTLMLTDFYRMQAEQAAKSAAEAAEEEAKAKVEEAVTRPLYAVRGNVR